MHTKPVLVATILFLVLSACGQGGPQGDSGCPMPASLWSAECSYCIATTCCAETAMCRADTECQAFLECAAPCGADDGCFINCTNLHRSAGTSAFQGCV